MRRRTTATHGLVEPLARRPAHLSVVVVNVLVDAIVSGRYPSGSLLPPEPVLCQSFDVSRSVVREALKMLEEKGLVRARQGHGTTITAPDEWNLLDPVVLEATIRADGTMQILDELVDVRVALECDMARTGGPVDERRRPGRARALLEELEPRSQGCRPLPGDLTPGTTTSSCAAPGTGSAARSSVRSIPMPGEQPVQPAGGRSDIRGAHLGHVAIYERLLSRDADGAAAAMQEHISRAWNLRKLNALTARRRHCRPGISGQPRPTSCPGRWRTRYLGSRAEGAGIIETIDRFRVPRPGDLA